MLPFEPRLTVGHDPTEENRNQACVERGPLVYCLESADLLPDVSLPEVTLPVKPSFREAMVNMDGLHIPAPETAAATLWKRRGSC